MKLFCIPYAGGGPQAFEGWADLLGPGIEVRVADLPGRGPRLFEAPPDTMSQLLALLEPQIQDVVDGPFALLGHSYGATAAYALARRLERRGTVPHRLIVGGARAPHLAPIEPLRHRMSQAHLLQEIQAMGGTDPAVLANHDLMSVYLPNMRADFGLLENYRPDPVPVSCPMSVFGGRHDAIVHDAELPVWRDLAIDRFELRVYDGGHFVVHSHREKLCRDLRFDLLAPIPTGTAPAGRGGAGAAS